MPFTTEMSLFSPCSRPTACGICGTGNWDQWTQGACPQCSGTEQSSPFPPRHSPASSLSPAAPGEAAQLRKSPGSAWVAPTGQPGRDGVSSAAMELQLCLVSREPQHSSCGTQGTSMGFSTLSTGHLPEIQPQIHFMKESQQGNLQILKPFLGYKGNSHFLPKHTNSCGGRADTETFNRLGGTCRTEPLIPPLCHKGDIPFWNCPT